MDGGQDTEPKIGKRWKLLIAIAAILVPSGTSVGLAVYTHHQDVVTALESKRYAYDLFISQASLTARDLQDVRDCEDVIDFVEHPPPKRVDSNGVELPTHIGTPLCDGAALADAYSVVAEQAAHERLQAKYMADYGQLAEPRNNVIRYADKVAAELANSLYDALGRPAEFGQTRFEDTLGKLKAERCHEIPAECR